MENIDQIDNLVLFDGVCNLCNASVDFIVKQEKGNELKFASLQSEIGQKVISITLVEPVPDSIVFWHKGALYFESEAVLKISQYLKVPFSWLRFFKLVPNGLRNLVYRLVAKNRYRFFGKKVSCRAPTQEERGKFLG